MNERDEDMRWSNDPNTVIKARIMNQLSQTVGTLHGLKENARIGMEQLFVPTAQMMHQLGGEVMVWVETMLQQACGTERMLYGIITTWIESRLGSSENLIAECDAKIAQHKRKLEKAAERDRLRSVNAGALSEPATMPPQPAVGGEAAPPPSPIRENGASFLGHQTPWPPPPAAGELDELIFPLTGDPGYLPLAAIPSGQWLPSAEEGIWFSLAPTPLTRAEIHALRLKGENVTPAGTVYLNSRYDMPKEALDELLRAFGLDPNGYVAWTPQEGYNAAVERFGVPMVDLTRRAHDMQDLSGRPTKLRDIPRPMPGVPAAPPGGDGEPADEPPRRPIESNGVHFTAAPLGGDLPGEEHPVIIPGLGGLFPANPFTLTHEVICAALQPFYDFMRIPQALRFPCASLAQAQAWLEQRYED